MTFSSGIRNRAIISICFDNFVLSLTSDSALDVEGPLDIQSTRTIAKSMTNVDDEDGSNLVSQ